MHFFEKAVILAVCTVVVAGVVLSRIDRVVFDSWYVHEDGPIESGTVIALLLGACACLWRAFRLRGRKPALFLAMTVLIGLIFLFGAGEEISWGKRILKFETPHWFEEHNTQHDITIHNLKFGRVKINKLVFSQFLGLGVVGYVLALPLLYRRRPGVVRICSALAIPVPRLPQILIIGAFALLVYGGASSRRSGELAEFALSWMFLLCVIFPRNAADFQALSPRARGGGSS